MFDIFSQQCHFSMEIRTLEMSSGVGLQVKYFFNVIAAKLKGVNFVKNIAGSSACLRFHLQCLFRTGAGENTP